MKSNDIKALHGKTIEELGKQQAELEMELAKTRFQKQAGKLKNTSLPRMLADDLARVKTILGEKKMMNEALVEETKTKEIKKPEAKKSVKKQSTKDK